MNRIKVYFIRIGLSIIMSLQVMASASQPVWPPITRQTRPWTRWWWMGSSVDPENLSAVMEEYRKAGLGGLEITPIYGVKGVEDRFIPYLSGEWMTLFMHVLHEAERLDLGIDMATGTGWPFGGPWIDADHACKYMVYQVYHLEAGEKLSQPVEYLQKPMAYAVRKKLKISDVSEPVSENDNLQSLALAQIRFQKFLPLQVLMAYSEQGDILNLTPMVDDNCHLNWTAPDDRWTLYAVFQGWHGKMVERAAPGGEGNVIDHFSKDAIEAYLNKFDNAFKGNDICYLRAFFNDSYEVDDASGEANYTPDLFREFKNRKGYDLTRYLPLLFSSESTEERSRLLCDYREVISELLLEKFTLSWKAWAEGKGAVIRNQAHGSPANILDLYAASHIPETEGSDLIQFKFASSAANVTGKMLASCEAATWLDEHFLASLAGVKQALDQYFLGGINHIVYHGTPYSPIDVEWPGWLFYAAVHFGPTNAFWKDFPKLNQYVTRCQAFLQSGKPANDILLYYPIYDKWSDPGRSLLQHFKGSLEGMHVRDLAETLMEQGYSFDFISDNQLQVCAYTDSEFKTAGSAYQTVIVPECRFIPLKTFIKLIDFAKAGGHIVFHRSLPEDIPGFAHLSERQKTFQNALQDLNVVKLPDEKMSYATIGGGLFVIGEDIHQLLEFIDILPESASKKGLRYVKRQSEGGPFYFIVNPSGDRFDDWVHIHGEAASVLRFDPMSGKSGLVPHVNRHDASIEVYLQLDSGESCILSLSKDQTETPDYPCLTKAQDAYQINGQWKIQFIQGGPVIPEVVQTEKLISWTRLKSNEISCFSGTARYTTQFAKPEVKADVWMLDLGKVCESAVVHMNGAVLDTLITPPFQITIRDDQLKDRNQLQIDVSNLMANRIIYLDQKDIEWKKFYNINFPSKYRKNMNDRGLFDASGWEPIESGLIGPVKLIPLETRNDKS
ncbi:glycoside hydrolase family 2 protein [bacterium]|nr:glycoside hydrolase family 2 protein [bacterium]